MKIKIKDWHTRRVLAVIKEKYFTKWCNEHGYLPHHKVGKSIWIVIN